jgi:riboflavin synthase
MFTGIIEAVNPIQSIRTSSGKTLVTFQRPADFADIKHGSSIACNGICLTVTEFDASSFTVEIMNETLKKTTAVNWQNADKVNLERALQIGSRLDGHWVQGHIDKTAALLETKTINSTLYLSFALSVEDKDLVIPQGSVAINGVSLTISELKADRFTVALIGHTITNTNLSMLKTGNKVNLEYDVLGKYLLRQKDNKSLDLEYLNEHGF